MSHSNYALMGKLTTSVLHDILTPITSLSLGTSLLEKDNVKDVAPLIDSSTQQVREFVDIMSEFLKESDSEHLTHINMEIGKSILLMSHKAKRHNVQIQFVEFDQIFSRTHPLYIYQIAINLISNAIDASAECECKKVVLVLKRMRNFYIIECKDFGIGMPSQIIKKICKAGFTTKSSGSGFGLYSVKHIVTQRLYGSLKIYSESNEGSLFSCKLPIRK